VGQVKVYHLNSTNGIEDMSSNGISIYPNPMKDKLNFEFEHNNIQKIEIFNITGKTLFEKTKIKQKETIDLSKFNDGVYIINIQTDNELVTTKIIKE
jgi:hypothetical protein